MAYTTVDLVKDEVGDGNIPSAITDAMIGSFVERADTYVDTWDISDSSSKQAVSTAYAAHILLKRIANGISTEADKFRLGKMSYSKAETVKNLNALAKEYKKEAQDLAMRTRGFPITKVNN